MRIHFLELVKTNYMEINNMANDSVDKLMTLKKKVKDLEEKKIASKTRLEEQRKQYDTHLKTLKDQGIEDVTALGKVIEDLNAKKIALLERITTQVEDLEKRIKENV
jgi:septal ring factor EnvC (AmiA/AmiB activator)